MTNKEKVAELIDQLLIQDNNLRNALHWDYSQKDIRYIADKINGIKNDIINLAKD